MKDRSSPSRPTSQTSGQTRVASSCWSGAFLKAGELLSSWCGERPRSSLVSDTVKHHVWESTRPHETLEIGSLLLHYDPLRPFERCYTRLDNLGTGSFGSVYRARCVSTGALRAVKVMKMTKVRQDTTAVVTEIEAMLRLSHPNVVRFHEFFESEGSICVVMGLCNGHFGKLVVGPAQDPAELRLLFRDVMTGVAYCHGKGIVHRDIKLENCLLYDGVPRVAAKVADFGLAAIRREYHNPMGEHWLHEPLGTRCFVAPEVVQKRTRYGKKCDVWSLGVTLYVLLTREHPFCDNPAHQDARSILRSICSAPLRTRPLQRLKVDPDASDLIKKLLVRDATERPDASSALGEPWLRPHAPELTLADVLLRSDPEELLRRIISFVCLPLFAKVALMMVSHRLTLQQVEEMRNAFLALDTYGSGKLSKERLQEGLTCRGHEASAELQELKAALPQDDLSYGVWVSATMEPSIVASEDAARELFRFFDADGNGAISCEELCRVVGHEEALRVMRTKGSGSSPCDTIGWDEFRMLMQDVAQSRKEALERMSRAKARGGCDGTV